MIFNEDNIVKQIFNVDNNNFLNNINTNDKYCSEVADALDAVGDSFVKPQRDYNIPDYISDETVAEWEIAELEYFLEFINAYPEARDYYLSNKEDKGRSLKR